jgi:hypothetical protein
MKQFNSIFDSKTAFDIRSSYQSKRNSSNSSSYEKFLNTSWADQNDFEMKLKFAKTSTFLFNILIMLIMVVFIILSAIYVQGYVNNGYNFIYLIRTHVLLNLFSFCMYSFVTFIYAVLASLLSKKYDDSMYAPYFLNTYENEISGEEIFLNKHMTSDKNFGEYSIIVMLSKTQPEQKHCCKTYSSKFPFILSCPFKSISISFRHLQAKKTNRI